MSNSWNHQNKKNATENALENPKYEDVPIEVARMWAAQEMALEKIDKVKEINTKLKDSEYYYGEEITEAVSIHDQEQHEASQAPTEVFVDVHEENPVDIEVYRIPAQKLGEIALADE